MPHPKIHELIDKTIFGQSFPHVHKWLDSNFNGKNGHVHWIKYHHTQAIEKKYGKVIQYRERQVAKLHVLVDWLFRFNVIFVPSTGSDVMMKLMEHGVVIL